MEYMVSVCVVFVFSEHTAGMCFEMQVNCGKYFRYYNQTTHPTHASPSFLSIRNKEWERS